MQQQVEELTLEELEEILGPKSTVNWSAHIEVLPGVVGGRPKVKGTRLAADFILDAFAGGATLDDMLLDYPKLTVAEINAVFAFAAETLRIEKGRATGLRRDESDDA